MGAYSSWVEDKASKKVAVACGESVLDVGRELSAINVPDVVERACRLRAQSSRTTPAQNCSATYPSPVLRTRAAAPSSMNMLEW